MKLWDVETRKKEIWGPHRGTWMKKVRRRKRYVPPCVVPPMANSWHREEATRKSNSGMRQPVSRTGRISSDTRPLSFPWISHLMGDCSRPAEWMAAYFFGTVTTRGAGPPLART